MAELELAAGGGELLAVELSPEVLALLAAVAAAVLRETLAWVERRRRRAGEIHTRAGDHPDEPGGVSPD